MSYEIRVTPDEYRHDPPNMGGRAIVHSFNRRHLNFADPDDFGLVMKGDRVTSIHPGIRRRLETGTAFILSAYDHSGIVWSLGGEGFKCSFDTAPVAGILFIERQRGKGLKERQAEARAFLQHWNAWCNGDIWDVSVWENDDPIDSASCFGFEVDGIIKDFAAHLPPDCKVIR